MRSFDPGKRVASPETTAYTTRHRAYPLRVGGRVAAWALPIGLTLAMATACASPSALTRPGEPHPSLPSSPQDSQDSMNAIKQGIDELEALDLSDIPALDQRLSAHLEEESSNQWFTVRHSKTGRFAGLPADIELRTSHGDATKATLVIRLIEPGPEAIGFVRQFWPDAYFYPPRPDAPGSAPAWSIKRADSEITIGGAADQQGGITDISIKRTP